MDRSQEFMAALLSLNRFIAASLQDHLEEKTVWRFLTFVSGFLLQPQETIAREIRVYPFPLANKNQRATPVPDTHACSYLAQVSSDT